MSWGGWSREDKSGNVVEGSRGDGADSPGPCPCRNFGLCTNQPWEGGAVKDSRAGA